MIPSHIPYQRPKMALLRYGLLAGLALGGIQIGLNIGYRDLVPLSLAPGMLPFFYDFLGPFLGNILLWSIEFFVLGTIAARIFKRLEGVEAALLSAPWASLSSGSLFVGYLFIVNVLVPQLFRVFTFSEIVLLSGEVALMWIIMTLIGIGLSSLGGLAGEQLARKRPPQHVEKQEVFEK